MNWNQWMCLLLLISMLWHRQAIYESKGDKLSSSAECRIRTWKSQDTYSQADWMPTHKPNDLSRIKQNLNSTARPYDEWAFSPLDFTVWLSFGFRTWLWRYTCLLLLISMLWHRQAILESKGRKLSSSNHTCIYVTVKTVEQPICIVLCKWKYEQESMNMVHIYTCMFCKYFSYL